MTNAICMAPDSFSRLPLRDSAAERKGFESGTLSDRMRDRRGMRTHCPYPGGSAFARLDSSAENHRQEESNNLTASGGKQVDDLLDGFIGAVVGGFEFAGRLVSDVGAAMEAAVGERAAEPLVEEQEEQRHLDAFGCEAIGVAGAIALQQAVGLELAQVVADLVQAVSSVGEVEAGKNGVVDLFGGRAAEMTAAMQEDFEEADNPGVVDLDAGIANRADGNRKGEALQQREVDMDIGPLCLEGRERAGVGLEG